MCPPAAAAFVPFIPRWGTTATSPSQTPRRAYHLCATYRVPNYTTPDYSSPHRQDHLLEAIKFNDYDTFIKLVDTLPNGANTTFPNKSNQSALLSACFRGRTDMIRYLVQRGADCAYVNDWGWGAVKYCKQWYWNLNMLHEGQQIVDLLIANGAEDIKDWRPGSQNSSHSPMVSHHSFSSS